MSMPKCLFPRIWEGLTEVCSQMSAGTSGRKLPLWGDFQAVLDGVPPTGRQLLRQERVLLAL